MIGFRRTIDVMSPRHCGDLGMILTSLWAFEFHDLFDFLIVSGAQTQTAVKTLTRECIVPITLQEKSFTATRTRSYANQYPKKDGRRQTEA